jgi:hypothetical protein
MRAFRTKLEGSLLSAHGSISVYQASVVATACTAMGQWKRMEKIQNTADNLSIEQQLAVSDRIIKHKQAVDLALAKLGLDGSGKRDPWQVLMDDHPLLRDAPPIDQDAPENAATAASESETAEASQDASG